MAATLALGASAARRESSNLSLCTNLYAYVRVTAVAEVLQPVHRVT
jgi:hypothetical protein